MPWPNLCCGSRQAECVIELDYSHQNLNDVPSSVFASERTLQRLQLSANRIAELPRALFYCHQLTNLDLSDNQIKIMPPAIASLINLRYLNLSRNGLCDIPDNIKCCKQLVHLNVSVNPLEKLPDGFTQLIALEELLLSETFLEYLPANFGRLSKLRILDLSDNNLNTLPRSMARLTSLQDLDIGRNEFSDLPEVIGTLVELTDLMVDANKIRSIPPYFGNLHRLQSLDISNNNLQWISPEIEDCVLLSYLILSSNDIQTLPDEIGNLKRLTFLKVDDNALTSVPQTIGKLTNLEELILSENSIEHLPPTIGLLRKLETLMIDDNRLFQLPSELCSCLKLRILSVRNNLIDCLPSEMGHLTDVHVISLTGNRLHNLPISVLDLRNLSALWLSANQATPLTTLQQEMDPTSGKMVCTSILFPQSRQPYPVSSSTEGDGDEEQPLQKIDRPHIRFAENVGVRLPSPLTRAPTPYPKELRSMAKHARILSTRPLSTPDPPLPASPTPVVAIEVKTATVVKPMEMRSSKSPESLANVEPVVHASMAQKSKDVSTPTGIRGNSVANAQLTPPLHEMNVTYIVTYPPEGDTSGNDESSLGNTYPDDMLVPTVHNLNETDSSTVPSGNGDTSTNDESLLGISMQSDMPMSSTSQSHQVGDTTYSVSSQNGLEEEFSSDESFVLPGIEGPTGTSSPFAVPRGSLNIKTIVDTMTEIVPVRDVPFDSSGTELYEEEVVTSPMATTLIDNADGNNKPLENGNVEELAAMGTEQRTAKVPPPYHIAAAYSKQAALFNGPSTSQDYTSYVDSIAEPSLVIASLEISIPEPVNETSNGTKPKSVTPCRIPTLIPHEDVNIAKNLPSKIPLGKPETVEAAAGNKPKGQSRMLQPGYRVAAQVKTPPSRPAEKVNFEEPDIGASNGSPGVALGNPQGSFKSRIPALVATGKVSPAPVAPASPTWVFGVHKNPTVFPVTIIKNPGLGFTIGGGASGLPPGDPNQGGIFVTKVHPSGPASAALKPGDKILQVEGIDFAKVNHDHAVNILRNTKAVVTMMVSRMK